MSENLFLHNLNNRSQTLQKSYRYLSLMFVKAKLPGFMSYITMSEIEFLDIYILFRNNSNLRFFLFVCLVFLQFFRVESEFCSLGQTSCAAEIV